MTESDKKIEKYISAEAFNRAKEVMAILGLELPENYDVYTADQYYVGHRVEPKKIGKEKTEQYIIIFSHLNPLDVKYSLKEDYDYYGYLAFSRGYLEVAALRDGVFYRWERNGFVESLKISNGKRDNLMEQTEVIFAPRSVGIQSSMLSMRGGNLNAPDFISYVDDVTRYTSYVDSKHNVKANIENYLRFVRTSLNDSWYSSIAMPESIRTQKNKDIIVSIFSRPINSLVDDLLTEDQFWRFRLEREAAIKKRDDKIKTSKRAEKDAVRNATNRLEAEEAYTKFRDLRREYELDMQDAIAKINEREEIHRGLREKRASMILEQNND